MSSAVTRGSSLTMEWRRAPFGDSPAETVGLICIRRVRESGEQPHVIADSGRQMLVLKQTGRSDISAKAYMTCVILAVAVAVAVDLVLHAFALLIDADLPPLHHRLCSGLAVRSCSCFTQSP